jgi:hypothetical protein
MLALATVGIGTIGLALGNFKAYKKRRQETQSEDVPHT